MKIYILSDSHNSFNFSSFLKLAEAADMVIHCGDGTRDIEALKAVLDCPVYSVHGNCDMYGSRDTVIEALGHRIFVTHGHDYGVKYSLTNLLYMAGIKEADIVLYGHTHIPEISYTQDKLVINPGSLTQPRDNRMPTYCILTLEKDKVYPELIEYKGGK